MFAFALYEHRTGRLILARDRLGIKPLYLDQTGTGCASPRPCRRCWPAAAPTPRSTSRPSRYYMSFHSVVPAPRTILNGIRKLPPATVRTVEPDGTQPGLALLGAGVQPRPGRRPTGPSRTGRRRCWPPCAPRSTAGWSPTSRSASCCPAASTPAWSSPCWPRPGSTDCRPSASASSPRAASPATSSSTRRLVAERFETDHHKIPIPSSRLLPGIDAAIGAMSEPMVSHDCVAFYLLSQEVAKSVKVVQSGQGADEVLGATTGTRRWPASLADGRRRGVRERVLRPALGRRRRAADAGVAGRPRRADRLHHRAVRSTREPRRRWTPRSATTRRSCWSTTR